MSRPLRVGIVPYLNMLPLIHEMANLTPDDSAERPITVTGVAPSAMITMMEKGELDVGMAPVAAVFDHPEWRIVGSSMIGSRGEVLSVLASGQNEPDQWRTLHLDGQSRTSNALVQVLLDNVFGVRPRLVDPIPAEGWAPPESPDPDEAFLLIGTRALRWRDHWRSRGQVTLDLGEAWTQWTALPFVYAVWTARPGVELGDWMERFEALKRENQKRLKEIIPRWPGLAGENLTPAQAETYLKRNIVFDLNDDALSAMDRFYREGLKLKLFKPGWDLDSALQSGPR